MSGRRLGFDRILFLTIVFLTLFGLVMVGSASVFNSLGSSSAFGYLIRQASYAIAGFVLMYLLMRFDYRRYNNRAIVAVTFVGSALLLVAVLFTPAINGAHRWIALGPIHVQVSELAKLSVCLFLAYTLDRKADEIADVRHGVIPTLGACGVISALILIEPDTGTAVLLGFLTLAFLFLAGAPKKILGLMGGTAVVLLAAVIASSHYRLERFLSFLDPSRDPLGSGFQVNQSLIALGSGGTLGVGLGQGQQKAFYLPFPHSDFIFSVIGEELGLIGTIAVLLLFCVILWRGTRAALRAPDNFGLYLGLSLTLLITVQALFNIGVASGVLPTKGLPLPFVSYGGSSLIVALGASGVLLNISQHSN